ncbi:PREDICTED: sterol regulatory element-binding protein cleavage-activating protein-like [Priapulus caudatus]|uniref:Sterol regulatory element-binding protein cleavage-activating protein-like n=1 Tax=Priapulus caudatus TaxID=37621 RepID=A0ABM1EAW6_PRICU|nr:PREDICTED: sterol regulatory element-binding protein cleavage-activating protein-like [Priapulus caudatus]
MEQREKPAPPRGLARCREAVSCLYHHHGLFCSSHPYAMILFVIVLFCYVCYPLTRFPLPGNAPVEFATTRKEFEYLRQTNGTETFRPRWYNGSPMAYMQQVLVKAVVRSLWVADQQLIPPDAFRAPLSKVFDVVDVINSFKVTVMDSDEALRDTICF